MIISLIVGVILLILAFWALRTLAGTFGLPPQIVAVLNVVFVVLFVLWILQIFGLLSRVP